jgi:hypothetical protein
VLVPAAVCHRLLLRPEAAIQGQTAQSLLADVLLELPVPKVPAAV